MCSMTGFKSIYTHKKPAKGISAGLAAVLLRSACENSFLFDGTVLKPITPLPVSAFSAQAFSTLRTPPAALLQTWHKISWE